jgi:hypothetical protein
MAGLQNFAIANKELLNSNQQYMQYTPAIADKLA